jgi:Rhamnan synthesis protein F
MRRLLLGAAARLHAAWVHHWRVLHGWAAYALSLVERGDAVLADLPGRQPELGPRVALFCHFDGRGEIRPHTRKYIDALCAEGFSVVLVSNSGQLAPPSLAWASERVARTIIRKNLGYDFAAWRDGLLRLGLPAAATECLVIANDSVYGPFGPLGPLLSRMDFGAADAWGLTENWQIRYHLQSYFLAFGRRAMTSDAFGSFWRGVRDVRSKWWVVRTYEVGLTQALLAAGLRCQALWEYDSLIGAARQQLALEAAEEDGPGAGDPFQQATLRNYERVVRGATRRVALNPTSDLWLLLLGADFPFIKRELLRENPGRVPDVAAWRSAMAGLHEADRALITRDLQRSLRGIAP